jgi:signal transduction histidine kinase
MASGLNATVRDWLESCRTDVGIAARELGDTAELTARLSRRLTSLQHAQRELVALAECPARESRTNVDVAAAASNAIESFATHTQKSEISISLEAPQGCQLLTYPKAFQLMLRALVEHAIFATPKGKSVQVRVQPSEGTLQIDVADSGPNVPKGERDEIVRLTKDPTHLGRPGGISLLVAHIVASRLGGTLTLGEGADSRTETRVRLTTD